MRNLILFTSLGLILLTIPANSSGEELERGEASLSAQQGVTRTATGTITDFQYETDLLFNFMQETVNWGRIETDVTASYLDGDVADDGIKAGRYTLGLKDFWLGDETAGNLELGDTMLDFRPSPYFFQNFQMPVATFRGFSSDVGDNIWKTKYFFGVLTEREGILGNIYQNTDQLLYGFNFGLELPRENFLGGGYLGTYHEEDAAGNLLVRNNNVFMGDARLGIVKDFVIMGEYLQSYYDSVADGKVNDHSLIVGPHLDKDKGSLQANYRNFDRRFKFINSSYQTPTSEEGAFVYGDLKLREELGIFLYGSSDYYWDNPDPALGFSRLKTWANNAGITYYPSDEWYMLLNSNVITKDSSDLTNPSDELRYGVSVGTSGYIASGGANLYSRFQYREVRVDRPSGSIEREPEGLMGVRWNVSRRFQMEWEGGMRNLKDSLGTKNDLISEGNYFIYWRPLSKIYFNPGVEYVRTDDMVQNRERNEVSLTLGYGHQLHRGWSISTNGRWAKGWGLNADTFFDVFVNIEKAFNWGRPVLRKGVPTKDQNLVCGDIRGYLFVDENGDQIKQPWEKGIADIPVILDGMFIAVTDSRGEFVFDNVLVGDRTVALEVRALELSYIPLSIRKRVDVKLRRTEEIFFPVKLSS